jgi:hypothetical protein
LKNFTLAGLSGTQNAKYKTALQIYNWHQEAGTTYSVAEIKKKFFTINKNALGKTATQCYDMQHAPSNIHHNKWQQSKSQNKKYYLFYLW